MTRRQLVCIARYNESLDWLDPMCRDVPGTRVVVYDKAPEAGMYANVGREAETFARCIVDIYDHLHRFTHITFLQAYPFDHVSRDQVMRCIRDTLHTDDAESSVLPLGRLHVSDAMGNPDHPGLPIGAAWTTLMSGMDGTLGRPPPTDRWTFVAGAQYRVHVDVLRQYPKQFWQRLHGLVCDGRICPWTMERFWLHIFGPNQNLV
jgi:hypothetical protein